MASLKDLNRVLRTIGPLSLGRRVYRETSQDNVFTNAAAMAYAWVFAVFPLIIFLMTLVPYLPEKFRKDAPAKVGDMMYASGMQYNYVWPVQSLAESLLNETHRGLLSFGLLLTLYAASGGMNTTMAGLDAALDVDRARPFWLKRLIAMGLTIFMGASFVTVLLLLPVGSQLTNLVLTYRDRLPDVVQPYVSTWVVVGTTVVRYVVGLGLLQIMIGVLYYVGPSRRTRMRWLSPGGLFAATGWVLTGFALRLYFAHFDSYSKTYGAVAGLVVMLLVFYLDATLILVGAEINNEVDKARDETTSSSAPNPDDPNEAPTTETSASDPLAATLRRSC